MTSHTLGKEFIEHITDEGIVSKIYTSLNFNNEKTSNPIKIWATELSKLLTNKDLQVSNIYMQWYALTIFVIS
jgi:hypothetical protein